MAGKVTDENDPVSVPGIMSPEALANDVVDNTLLVVEVEPLKANEPATNAAALAPVVARASTAALAAKIESLFSMLLPLYLSLGYADEPGRAPLRT